MSSATVVRLVTPLAKRLEVARIVVRPVLIPMVNQQEVVAMATLTGILEERPIVSRAAPVLPRRIAVATNQCGEARLAARTVRCRTTAGENVGSSARLAPTLTPGIDALAVGRTDAATRAERRLPSSQGRDALGAKADRLLGHDLDSRHESEECRAGGDSESLPGFRTPQFYHFQAQSGIRFAPLPGEWHPGEDDE